jgi:hypothetical protein
MIDSPYPSSKLKERLLATGYKERRCEDCGLAKWNRSPFHLSFTT